VSHLNYRCIPNQSIGTRGGNNFDLGNLGRRLDFFAKSVRNMNLSCHVPMVSSIILGRIGVSCPGFVGSVQNMGNNQIQKPGFSIEILRKIRVAR
jgi:hypothetical protein